MTDFISAADAAANASYSDQKALRDEVVDIRARITREMDRGLTPEEMKAAQAEKAAADAAEQILSRLF